MSLSSAISRFGDYYDRNGFRATLSRFLLEARRALFFDRMVIFYCDLRPEALPQVNLPECLKVERYRDEKDVGPQDLHAITSFWNPNLAQRRLDERFRLGASLWLIKFEEQLAGYGWTLRGRTVEPHYFPLAKHDVQFLDFHVFPKYRGRAIDWFLMTYILHELAVEGCARAFGEAAEWNQPSLASFGMTPFCRLGIAKKIAVHGNIIVWSRIRDESVARKANRGARISFMKRHFPPESS